MLHLITRRHSRHVRLATVIAMLSLLCGALGFAPAGTRAAPVCDITNDLINPILAANATPTSMIQASLTAGCVYTLSTTWPGPYYAAALPAISGHLVIEGNGATLERSSAAGTPSLRFFTIDYAGSLSLTDVTLRGGSAGIWSGGAILNNHGDLSLSNSLLIDNSAGGGFGGAIRSIGTAHIQQSRITGSSAKFGGAIVNIEGTLIVQSSTIDHNTTNFGWAALANESSERIATTDLIDSTVVDNLGTVGAGVSNTSNLHVSNSTIAGNTGVGLANHNESEVPPAITTLVNTIIANIGGGDCDASYNAGGAIADNGHNLTSDGSCFLSEDNHSLPNTDPLFDPAGLADNGGPTPTLALTPASPAIDAGDATACAADPVNGLDQRGAARPQGAGCDIGAYELLVPAVTPASATSQDIDTSVALSATVIIPCSSTATYCPVINDGTVTFTVADSQGNIVRPAVSANVTAGAATTTIDPSGIAPGSYVVTAEYQAASDAIGASRGTSTLTITPGPPVTLTLAPGTTNSVVGQHVVEIATVLDTAGYPVADSSLIDVSISGETNSNSTLSTSQGHVSVDLTEEFPGTDTVTFTAEGGTQPGAAATITWTAPPSTGRSSLTIMSLRDPEIEALVTTGPSGGEPNGSFTFASSGLNLREVHLLSLTVNGSSATVYGTSQLADGTTVAFKLDATAARVGGTIRVTMSDGYDSGTIRVPIVRITP
jgi:hypothetical protein